MKSRHFYEACKVARNKTYKIVEKAKSRDFQHTINNDSNDLKQLWKGINLIRSKGSKTTKEETITGDKNVAETLNSFFVNVGPSSPESQTIMLITCNVLHTMPLPLMRSWHSKVVL